MSPTRYVIKQGDNADTRQRVLSAADPVWLAKQLLPAAAYTRYVVRVLEAVTPFREFARAAAAECSTRCREAYQASAARFVVIKDARPLAETEVAWTRHAAWQEVALRTSLVDEKEAVALAHRTRNEIMNDMRRQELEAKRTLLLEALTVSVGPPP